MVERRQWVTLAYRIPREPSTPRIALWRKLRQLGAAQIVDGLAALPADERTQEQFEWLAQNVREAAGEAWVWLGALTSRAQERALVQAMSAAIVEEYERLAEVAREAQTADPLSRRRTLARLRRELRRITSRDYFGCAEQRAAKAALERLAARSTAEARS